MNVLEDEHLEISINLNIVVSDHIVVMSVYFCLLVYHYFMLVFVVILSSTIICKQVAAFVFNFNVKQC